jgi:HK97 family phage portal protein
MNLIQNIFNSFKNIFRGKSNDAGWFSIFTNIQNKKEYYYGLVYACIDKIATNVSTTEFYLVRKDDKKRERVYNNDVLDLIRRPNRFQTGTDLLYIISAHIDTHGAAFIYPAKNAAGKIVQLFALSPECIKVVKGDTIENMITGYIYQVQGKRIPFNYDDIVIVPRFNPHDQTNFISTIEMAKHEIENDYNAIIWNKKFFENGAIPSGILTTDQTISEDAFKTLKSEWHEQYEGKENAHKTALLHSGLKYDVIAPKQKDMDYVEGRKFSQTQILAIFGVPKSVLAISDDVNRANAEVGDYVFAKRTVKPRLSFIYEKLNRFLLPKLDVLNRFELQFENPVPDDKDYTLTRKEKSTKWVTINEIREEEGRKPIPDGDLLYEEYILKRTNKADAPNPKGIDEKKKSNSEKGERFITEKDDYLDNEEVNQNYRVGKHYKKLISLIRVNKKKQITDITKATADDLMDEVYPNTVDWKEELIKKIEEMGSKTIRASFVNGETVYSMGVEWNLVNDLAQSWLKDNARFSGESFDTSMRDRTRTLIADALAGDADKILDVSKLKKLVADQLALEEEYRVERLVRTELNSAYNESTLQQMRISNVVQKKEWRTYLDNRTRDAHRNANGQTVQVNMPFTVDGENLDRPGDPKGSAANIINCRCTSLPVVND